jgi:hypothetical protein
MCPPGPGREDRVGRWEPRQEAPHGACGHSHCRYRAVARIRSRRTRSWATRKPDGAWVCPHRLRPLSRRPRTGAVANTRCVDGLHARAAWPESCLCVRVDHRVIAAWGFARACGCSRAITRWRFGGIARIEVDPFFQQAHTASTAQSARGKRAPSRAARRVVCSRVLVWFAEA